jgi:putative ABC transport system permease protein
VNTSLRMVRLGAQQFWRELVAGQLKLLLASLGIAVFGITAVASLGERVRGAMTQQAGALLGGDVVLRSDVRPDARSERRFLSANLVLARSAEFPSMVQAHTDTQTLGSRFKLVQIKATSQNYPLRGAYRLRVAQASGERESTVSGGVPRGEVWVANRLRAELALDFGSPLKVGDLALKVSGFIVQEPDAGFDLAAIAPRVIMHEADLAATGLDQVGARIQFRLVGIGTPADVNAFARDKSWLMRGQSLITVRSANSAVQQGMARAQQFFALTLLAALVLSAAALALSSWRYAQTQLDGFAVLRTFGASTRMISTVLAVKVLLAGLCSTIVGIVLAECAQRGLAQLVQQQFAQTLPAAGLGSWGIAVAAAAILLVGFSAPTLLGVRHVPAMRVISRIATPQSPGAVLTSSAGLAAFFGLAVLVVGDVRLSVIVLGGLAAALLLLAGFGYASIQLLGRLRARLPTHLRLQTAGLVRRARVNTMAISAIGLSATALILLTLLRTDLLDQWRRSLPADAPNRFVINVQDDQLVDFRAALNALQINDVVLWPMLRGRLRSINGAPLNLARFTGVRDRRLAGREFNLSVSARLPKANALVDETGRAVSGLMFPPSVPGLSLEIEIAKMLGVKRDDILEFDIGGVPLRAPVLSLRKVNWESLQPNFFALASPAAWRITQTPEQTAEQTIGQVTELPTSANAASVTVDTTQAQNYPAASWMTALRVASGRTGALADSSTPQSLTALVAQFPNITVIDLDQVEAQVRQIADQASRAIELVFWFTVSAGLLVLLAAIHATQAERQTDAAVMRAIGASKAQLLSFDRLEFAWIGLLAGGIGAIAASAITLVLMQEIFQLRYEINFSVLALGTGGTVILVLSVGLIGTRRTRTAAPVDSLRAAD